MKPATKVPRTAILLINHDLDVPVDHDLDVPVDAADMTTGPRLHDDDLEAVRIAVAELDDEVVLVALPVAGNPLLRRCWLRRGEVLVSLAGAGELEVKEAVASLHRLMQAVQEAEEEAVTA